MPKKTLKGNGVQNRSTQRYMSAQIGQPLNIVLDKGGLGVKKVNNH